MPSREEEKALKIITDGGPYVSRRVGTPTAVGAELTLAAGAEIACKLCPARRKKTKLKSRRR